MVSFMVSFSTCVLFKYFVSICNNTEINNEMQNETLTDRGNYFLVYKLELEMLVIKYNDTVHQHATSLAETDTGN